MVEMCINNLGYTPRKDFEISVHSFIRDFEISVHCSPRRTNDFSFLSSART